MSELLEKSAVLTPEQAALALADAERTGTPIPALRDRLASSDADTAYAIQEANTKAALSQGRRPVGRKIGLTSLAVQAQLGVDQPDFGMLFADMAVGDGLPIPAGRLIQPKVEAEIALILGRDLTHERHTVADIMRATDHAVAAIEIVDSRIAQWDIRFFDTVADNASSGLFVLGSAPKRLDQFDIGACTMEMHSEGKLVSSGNSAACMGNPLNAAIWLADMMVRCGRPLLAGDVVLTGALGPMVAVPTDQGSRFDTTISGLGSVSALFA